MECLMTGGAGLNWFKSTIEFRKIFGIPLSMGISLALVDHFVRASVIFIFGTISTIHLGFASRTYFVERGNKNEVDSIE